MIFENLSVTTRMEFVESVTVCSVRHGMCCSGLISFMFDWILVKFKGIKKTHIISYVFQFWPDWTINF